MNQFSFLLLDISFDLLKVHQEFFISDSIGLSGIFIQTVFYRSAQGVAKAI